MGGHAHDRLEADCEKAKRAAPRLPLSLPGTFISTLGNHNCILTNLSCTGVLIAMSEPLRVGSAGFLRCGPLDHFVIVKRQGVGLNAAVFEISVSDAFVAQVREYQNSFATRELSELLATAQAWTGMSD
jgi:hypothetical protein